MVARCATGKEIDEVVRALGIGKAYWSDVARKLRAMIDAGETSFADIRYGRKYTLGNIRAEKIVCALQNRKILELKKIEESGINTKTLLSATRFLGDRVGSEKKLDARKTLAAQAISGGVLNINVLNLCPGNKMTIYNRLKELGVSKNFLVNPAHTDPGVIKQLCTHECRVPCECCTGTLSSRERPF